MDVVNVTFQCISTGDRELIHLAANDRLTRSTTSSEHITLDDVAVGHEDADERQARCRRRTGEERTLAFEDADEPMELVILYAGTCGLVGDACQWD